MSGIHFYAMSAAIRAAVRRGKPLKILLIILLVWIAPSLLLFFYLMWKSQLLARYVGSLKPRLAELAPNASEPN